MIETKRSRLSSQDGFSLTELSIAAGVAIFVSLGVGMILVNQQEVENSTSFQTSLDMGHALAIQKVRNGPSIATALDISGDEFKCFGKSSEGTADCTTVINPTTAFLPGFFTGDSNNGVCVDPPACLVKYDVRYDATGMCSTTRCEKIHLNVRTYPTPEATLRNKYAKERVTTIVIPGFLFASKTAINFVCGPVTTSVPSSINFKTLEMNCGPTTIPPRACASNFPLSYFDQTSSNCQTPENRTCANGVKTVGTFMGQVGCT